MQLPAALTAALAEAARRRLPLWLTFEAPWCAHTQAWRRQVLEAPEVLRAGEGWPRLTLGCDAVPALDDAAQFTARQMGASSGWPLCLFLEPSSGAPIFCVTAPTARFLEQALAQLRVAWELQGDALGEQAQRTRDNLQQQDFLRAPETSELRNAAPWSETQISAALQRLWVPFAQNSGADGLPAQDPVFHQTAALSAMLSDPSQRDLAYARLTALARSSLCDVLGGGFFRSAQLRGSMPQVASEKLLHENAAYLELYALAYAQSGQGFFAQVAVATARCLLEEFWPADAPGPALALSAAPAYYSWRRADLLDLPGALRQAAAQFFSIDNDPGFPRLATDVATLAHDLAWEPVDLQNALFETQGRLLRLRQKRVGAPARHHGELASASEALALRALLWAEPLLHRAVQENERDAWRTRVLRRLESLLAHADKVAAAEARTPAAMARAAFMAFFVSGERRWLQNAESFLSVARTHAARTESPWLGWRTDARDHLGPSAYALLLDAELDAWEANGRSEADLPALRAQMGTALDIARPLGLMGAGVYRAAARSVQRAQLPTYF